MPEQIRSTNFGSTAQGLAKNPLGIIALFIVFVYFFASIVITLGSGLSMYERLPLVYFMVLFPVLVLGVFTWLVSFHSGKLFAPSDFKDEDNYIKMQMAAVASLSVATAKDKSTKSEMDINKLIEVVQGAVKEPRHSNVGNRILWVDDNPDNNIYERRAFKEVGLNFTIATSTEEAFQKLENQQFAAIISDMGRREGPREGYVLLDRLRAEGDKTPLFIYASSNSPQHKQETLDHGGQGCTNNPQELFEMVTRSVILRNAD